MGEKAATKEVIEALVNVVGDRNSLVSMDACEALGEIGVKAATKEVIDALVQALGNHNDDVRTIDNEEILSEKELKLIRYLSHLTYMQTINPTNMTWKG
ncbi:unnamed protein product [Rotaria magnacalcarata]|uniref:HEAT repeat domain-containing protein n=1 Tax=Rotaria magnacalcarata TaxID=392030 RepID=A0A820FV07_9BILA|nr:unnamed protein product [Rotaria magnacalcarata]